MNTRRQRGRVDKYGDLGFISCSDTEVSEVNLGISRLNLSAALVNAEVTITMLSYSVIYLRPRPHVSGYFRIRNFFFADMATVHTHPANSTANPEKHKSAL